MLWGFIALKANAQTDSLYIDTKPRDGITKLTAIASCQRQIITAEQIRLSGYTRVSDLIQLADAMTFTTLNFNDWFVQTNGTGTYQNQSWVLMVNGQRIDMLKLGITDLNALGIAVQDIERIEIVNTPEMYLGEYADKGLVHIVTKKPVQGISQHGSVALRPNNEGFQTNIFQSLFYAKNNFSIGLTYNRNRNSDFKSNPVANNYGTDVVRLQANYGVKKIQQQLTLSVSDFVGTKISHDLNFNRYTLNQSANVGYLSQYSFNQKQSLRFSCNLTYPLYKTESTLGSIYIGQIIYFNSNFSYRFRKPLKKDILQLNTGVSFDSRPWYFTSSNSANYPNFVYHQNLLIKPYFNYSRPLNRKTWLNTDLSIVANTYDNTFGYKTTISLYKRVSILTNWSLVAFAGQKNQAELNSVNYTSASYGMEQTYNVPQKNQPNQFSINGNYAINMGNNFKLSFYSGLNYLDNEYYSVVTKESYYGNSYKSNFFNAHTFNNVIRFNVHHDVFENFYFDFNYMRTTQLGGHIEMASNIPKHKTTLILNYKLEKWLNIWCRNYYQSATTWYSLDLSNNIYLNNPQPNISQNVEGIFLSDIGFTARTKNEKFNLNLIIPNITYSNYRLFPLQNNNNMHFMLSLSWKFDGIFASSKGNQ